MSLAKVLTDVANERARQHQKWGQQDHQPERWLVILGEVFGNVCSIVKEDCGSELYYEVQAAAEYRKELVQVAAVVVAAIESHDRLMAQLERLSL